MVWIEGAAAEGVSWESHQTMQYIAMEPTRQASMCLLCVAQTGSRRQPRSGYMSGKERRERIHAATYRPRTGRAHRHNGCLGHSKSVYRSKVLGYSIQRALLHPAQPATQTTAQHNEHEGRRTAKSTSPRAATQSFHALATRYERTQQRKGGQHVDHATYHCCEATCCCNATRTESVTPASEHRISCS